MGNISGTISNALNSLFKGFNKEARILMLGLDAAGKTTIMYKYKLNETCRTIPTIGFNVETIQINKVNMTMWDIGGQNKIRPLWRHYYHGADSLIWVVDSSDTDRFHEMREELHSVLKEPELQNCTILVLANKIDLAGQNAVQNVTKALDLFSVANNRKWHVQGCCATTGEGLYEGMDWLVSHL